MTSFPQLSNFLFSPRHGGGLAGLVSLAQTALRLYPRRRAICAPLCPTAQSFLSSATSSASQLMGDTYTPTGNYRLACVAHGASPSDDLVVNAPRCQGAQDPSMMMRRL
jgi:hypothetical protein